MCTNQEREFTICTQMFLFRRKFVGFGFLACSDDVVEVSHHIAPRWYDDRITAMRDDKASSRRER